MRLEDIQLLGDRILVMPEAQKKETESGILLPEASAGKTQFGRVILAGDGRLSPEGYEIMMNVNKGDRIMYEKFAGDEIVVNDDTYLLMTERNVIAVINEDDRPGNKVLSITNYSRKRCGECDDDDDEE